MHLIGSRDGARFGAKVDVLKNIPTFEWLGKKAKNYDISGVFCLFVCLFFLPSTIYLPSLGEFPTSCQCVLERLLIRLILASTWQSTRIENHQTWFKSSEGPSARGKGGGGKERHKSLIVPDFEKCGKYEDFEDEIRRVARETAEMSLRLLGSGKIWQNP